MGKLKRYAVIANARRESDGDLEESFGAHEIVEESTSLGIYIAASEEAAIAAAIKENKQYVEIWDIRVYEIANTYKSKKSYVYGCLLEDKILTIPYEKLAEISEYGWGDPNLDPDIVVAIDLEGSNVDLVNVKELTQKKGQSRYARLSGNSSIWWEERLRYIINPPNNEIRNYIEKWLMSKI